MISIFINNNKGDNKIVSALGNEVTVNLNPDIKLDPKKKWQLRLLNLNCVYCMPNVTSKNNELWYTTSDNLSHICTFENGLYTLIDLNNTISLFTSDASNGNDSNLIQFFADEATSKIYVYFNKAHTRIDCSASHSIMQMLGFPVSSGVIGNLYAPGYVKSTNQAQLNAIQNILVKCDITTGSYMNSQYSNIIACVTPDVSSYSTIIYRPVHPVRTPVNVDRIETITITLVDQNNSAIDLGSDQGTKEPELFSAVLAINEIGMTDVM